MSPGPETSGDRPRGFVAGAGYIGGALARSLVREGWDVVALTRNEVTAADLERDGVLTVRSDLESDRWHASVGGQFDAIWNTVGSGGGGLAGFERSYVEGNRSIGGWLRAGHGATGFFAFTGSVSVYGQTDGEWVDESSPLDQCGPGGRLLLEAEAVVRDEFPAGVVRGTCRLSGIYGPGRHLLLNRLIDESGPIPGNPGTWLNLIHRDDAVRALIALPGRVDVSPYCYNLSDGNPSTRGDIVSWLAETLGRPVPPFDPSRSARPTAARTGAGGKTPDRRIDSSRIWSVAGISPLYSSYRAGYESILRDLA